MNVCVIFNTYFASTFVIFLFEVPHVKLNNLSIDHLFSALT